jgi:hypothetical protein
MRYRLLSAAAAALLVVASLLASAAAEAAEPPAWKWPAGNVPVCWANLVPPSDANYAAQEERRKWAKDVVNGNWGAFSGLEFTGWEACEAGSEDGIQIKIAWDGSTPSSSYVGRSAVVFMQHRGTPAVTLQFTPNFGKCLAFTAGCIVSATLHEFGHALGFQHEHRRPEGGPDFVCKFVHKPGEGDPLLKAEDEPVFVSGSYDGNSIMNYCPVFGGLFDSISESDVLGLQKHYGADPKGRLYAAATWKGRSSCELKYAKTESRTAAFRHWLGDCYACPAGYGRSINPDINAPTACAKGFSFARAIHVGKWGCPSGAFKNGVFDQCYSCPDGYDRTAVIASDLTKVPKACVRREWGVLKMLTIGLRPH